MDPAIIAALITGAASVAAITLTNYYQNRQAAQKMETKIALINQSIETLSERVDKHNSVIDRTYKLEEETAVMAERLRSHGRRIDDLEAKE